MATKVTKKKSAPAKKAVSMKPVAKKAASKKPATKKVVREDDDSDLLDEINHMTSTINKILNGTSLVILRMDYDVGVKGFWRQVAIPADFDLDDLHVFIQCLFGWKQYHAYNFTQGEQTYTSEENASQFRELEDKITSETFIGDLFTKKGDEATYEYDFGDENIVCLTCEGITKEFTMSDFGTEGQDAVEDSAGFGFIPGIIKLLTTEKGTPNAQECRTWLKAILGKTSRNVLRVPCVEEIYGRTLILLAGMLLEKCGVEGDEIDFED